MIRLQNRRITKKEKRDISASVVRVLRVLSNHRTQTPSHLCREITRQLGDWFERLNQNRESLFNMPAELSGVSQGFTSYHPGVDLRAPYGSPIHPVTEGVVKDVYFSNWGYGQAIVIEHANGYASMSAHVSRIF